MKISNSVIHQTPDLVSSYSNFMFWNFLNSILRPKSLIKRCLKIHIHFHICALTACRQENDESMTLHDLIICQKVSYFFPRTVRNLHFLSKNSTLISRENCRFFGVKTCENVVIWTFQLLTTLISRETWKNPLNRDFYAINN